MKLRIAIVILALAAAVTLPAGQAGVVSVEPAAAADPRCQVYIGTEIVLTFSLDVNDQPFLNIINYTEREIVLEAERIAVILTDGRRVRPSLLKIPTGQKDDFILRAYFRVHGNSNFSFHLAGLDEHREKIDRIEIVIHPYLYRLDRVRRDYFDLLLERLEHVSLNEESVSRAFRKQNIPLKGARERQGGAGEP